MLTYHKQFSFHFIFTEKIVLTAPVVSHVVDITRATVPVAVKIVAHSDRVSVIVDHIYKSIFVSHTSITKLKLEVTAVQRLSGKQQQQLLDPFFLHLVQQAKQVAYLLLSLPLIL